MPKSAVSYPKAYFFAVVALTAVGCVLWQMLCPWCSDDIPYSLAPFGEEYTDRDFWNAAGPAYSSAAQLWEGISGHLLYTSGRLSNILYIIVQLMPLRFVKLVCGLVCGMMYLGLVYFSVPEEKRGNPWLISLLTLLFWVMFPWDDTMQASVYVFNYPLPSVLMLLWLYFYFRSGEMDRKGKLVLLACAVPVAWMHEAFAVALCAFVFFDWLLNRRASRFPLAAAALIAGVVLFELLFLGTGGRVADVSFARDEIIQYYVWNKVRLVRDFAPVFVSLLLFGALLIFLPRGKKGAFFRRYAPFAGAMAVGLFSTILLRSVGRGAWAVEIFGCILLVRLAGELPWPRKIGTAVKAFFTILAGAYAFWLSELCAWQYRSTCGTEAVYRDLSPRGKATGIAYADRVYAADMPFYLMDFTVPVDEKNFCNNFFVAAYFSASYAPGILVLPERYRDIPVDSLPALPGTAVFRGEPPYLVSDYPYTGRVRLKGAEYLEGHNPLAPAMAGLKQRIFGIPADEAEPMVSTVPFVAQDSTVRYFLTIYQLPLSFRNRRIAAVDTLGNRYPKPI